MEQYERHLNKRESAATLQQNKNNLSVSVSDVSGMSNLDNPMYDEDQ